MHPYDRFIQTYSRLPTEFDSDYLELVKMSKYRILDVPDVQPGKCANCGSSKNDGRKYVDFGLHVDFYGAVYLCGWCLADIYKSLTSEDSKDTTPQVTEEQLLQVNQFFMKTLEEFKATYGQLESLVSNLRPTDDGRTIDGSFSSSAAQAVTKPSATAPKPGTVKSSTVSGRPNVPNLASLPDPSPRN